MNQFIDKLQKQLQIMSEKEKDAWIISQAKITDECKQEDFYKSICGIKKVVYERSGKNENRKKVSFLQEAWTQIQELINDLNYEPYIDDQVEIDEIWNIVEVLIKRGGFD